MEDKSHPKNRLALYRKRMDLSQKQVAALLGLKNPAILSHYERGTSLPSLSRALCLEIIYRVPVAFLFPDLYEKLRSGIRDKEGRSPHRRNPIDPSSNDL